MFSFKHLQVSQKRTGLNNFETLHLDVQVLFTINNMINSVETKINKAKFVTEAVSLKIMNNKDLPDISISRPLDALVK